MCKEVETKRERQDTTTEAANADVSPQNSSVEADASYEEEESEQIDFSKAVLKENQRRENSETFLNEDERAQLIDTSMGWNKPDNKIPQSAFNKEIVFDVLPSFEMYRLFQQSTPDELEDGPEDQGFPPCYHNNDTRSTTTATTFAESLMSSPRPASSYQASFVDQAPNTSSATSGAAAMANEGVYNLIDCAHNLPLKSSPIKLEIHITKDVPDPTAAQEQEAILKEYTSGDAVHGYVIVHNNSNEPVRFQQFFVSLEGVITVADPVQKKLISKKFLNMLDFSASWTYGCVFPSSNMKSYTPHSIDFEGCCLGLRNDRILAPKTKYKKFFTFKFPYTLLDTVCRHQQELHSLLPPSLGVDRFKNGGKFRDIEIDPALHYGHLYYRGTPILTKDLSNEKLAISYTINTKIIGTESASDEHLVRLAENEYSLRFVPFGFAVPLFSSKKSLESLCKQIDSCFTTAERNLKFEMEGQTDAIEKMNNEIKLQQLRIRTLSVPDETYSFPLRNQVFAKPEYSKIESRLKFVNNVESIGLRLFSKIQKNNSKKGLVIASSYIPKDGLPYRAPSLLRKTNDLSKLNKPGLDNYGHLSSTLSTNEKQKLNKIKVDLVFIPSSNDPTSLPPDIKHIEAKLLVMNIYSKSSIPIKLSTDLFLNGNRSVQDKFTHYSEKLTKLRRSYEKAGLSNLEYYFGKASIMDIEAMENIKSEEYKVHAFKIAQNKKESQQWKPKEENSNNEWKRRLIIDIDYMSDNMQETIIPTFQSCLISRQYCINLSIEFKGGIGSTVLNIPIRVRRFDD